MPKTTGVYRDSKGRWYFKVRTRDRLTGEWQQVTRRGFATAADAGRARSELLDEADTAAAAPALSALTVSELLELYLDDASVTGRLAAKTLFDYRHFADDYVSPWLGEKLVRELDAEMIAAWQHRLAKEGGTKDGRALSANTIRLARAPLAGALKYAVARNIVPGNPLASVPPPRARRKIPKHWSPEQARQFLALCEGDRLRPLWAFLLGSGLRIGEVVWLQWHNVDFERGLVRINEFATVINHEVVASVGKSRDAIRTVDIDEHLAQVLRQQRKTQASEQLASADYEVTDYVFTKPNGGAHHPNHLSKVLAQLTVECGLPRLTAHGLRHTSATLMLASGVAPKVAAERLGHADATLFSNLYSHVTPTMQREAAERIGAALFGE
ncbi:MAG TPA: tyrosine-type recombinase/integrase [Acidimicrobiales bacterium]|nr:tyrosine-type recombinase/integrase [Acidimicrobiales bacterium]